MSRRESRQRVRVGRRRLSYSNLDKLLYPGTDFDKGRLIAYYDAVSRALLPHLKHRSVTRKRYPDGVSEEHFFEKNCPEHRPEWLRTVRVASVQHPNKQTGYCVVEEKAALLWLANLAAIELHVHLHRIDDDEHPSWLVFDLDPGVGADLRDCARVAGWLRDLLAEHKLDCYHKTSGGKRLHVYLPLNGTVDYRRSKAFAKAIARRMADADPQRVTSSMRKAERRGKVFIDWSQNDPRKTTVCVYSLRGRERPTVSTPLRWEEVAACDAPDALAFTADQVVERVEKHGDLFAAMRKRRQGLPDLPG